MIEVQVKNIDSGSWRRWFAYTSAVKAFQFGEQLSRDSRLLVRVYDGERAITIHQFKKAKEA